MGRNAAGLKVFMQYKCRYLSDLIFIGKMEAV